MGSNAWADILLVTATKVETRAILDVFDVGGRSGSPQSIDGRVYFDLGTINGARVMMTQSEMGTSGLGASQQAVDKGLVALLPSAVIMVGIAFGVSEEKQRIGDVLVTEQLRLYELQRVGTEESGSTKIILRDDKPHASPWLLNLLKSSEVTWEGAEVRFGTILSGAKLVDNLDFREQLRTFEPEAVGGEMEGTGLYVACHARKVDWILVKGICDFADGQKGKDKSERQALAAKNAAAFVRHALQFASIDWNGHGTSRTRGDQSANANVDSELLARLWPHLVQLWPQLEPDLQETLALAHGEARRRGSNTIKTRYFFAALQRLRPATVAPILDKLPRGALPDPISTHVAPTRNLLDDNPDFSPCVEDSLKFASQHLPKGRRLTSADVFVDLIRYGTGASVASLREKGVGPDEIDRIIEEEGLPVIGHRDEFIRNNQREVTAKAARREESIRGHDNTVFKKTSESEKLKLLKEAADEGYIPAMYVYGMETDDLEEKRRYLKMAADEGYISAMYDYGMETDDLEEKRRYLKMAADEGYIPAKHEYARLLD